MKKTKLILSLLLLSFTLSCSKDDSENSKPEIQPIVEIFGKTLPLKITYISYKPTIEVNILDATYYTEFYVGGELDNVPNSFSLRLELGHTEPLGTVTFTPRTAQNTYNFWGDEQISYILPCDAPNAIDGQTCGTKYSSRISEGTIVVERVGEHTFNMTLDIIDEDGIPIKVTFTETTFPIY